jgi:hypothetical protein
MTALPSSIGSLCSGVPRRELVNGQPALFAIEVAATASTLRWLNPDTCAEIAQCDVPPCLRPLP